MDRQQAYAQFIPLPGLNRAAGNMDQPVAFGLDQAPARAAEPRIDAENANRMPDHGPVDSPGLFPRLACFASSRSGYLAHSGGHNRQRKIDGYGSRHAGIFFSSPHQAARRHYWRLD